MVKTFCDKCGAELPEMQEVTLFWQDGVKQEQDSFIPRRAVYQFCGRCARAVDDFINTKEAKK